MDPGQALPRSPSPLLVEPLNEIDADAALALAKAAHGALEVRRPGAEALLIVLGTLSADLSTHPMFANDSGAIKLAVSQPLQHLRRSVQSETDFEMKRMRPL